MAISMKKYVDIKSSTNTTRTATEKELIARIFTINAIVPVGSIAECENLDDVSTLFGSSSAEYKLAKKYFNFVNKYARSPRKISFARDFSAGVYAQVAGTVALTMAADYTNIQGLMGVSQTLTVSVDGTANDLSISIASEVYTDIDNVCNAIKSAINTALSGASLAITCDYANGKFSFTSNTMQKEKIEISGDVADIIKISSQYNPFVTEGAPESSYTDVFKKAYETSNNFATFAFLATLTAAQNATLASFVASTYPSEFVCVIPVTTANYATIQAAVATIDGVSLELCGTTEETGLYNFFMPMAIAATTDYNKVNGTVNYMYTQSDDMVVTVNDDTAAATYDAVKVNYYGQTQKSGQKLAFYQNGVLQGKYQDQNIFVNEIWLKDAMTTKYINYMLQASNWYANKSGQAIGQGLAMEVIERAKLNGTITTEKEISESDKVFIYNVTADENAWRQIYQEGFYIITSTTKEPINNQETYKFNYILLYSKGDSIKKVEGLNILI